MIQLRKKRMIANLRIFLFSVFVIVVFIYCLFGRSGTDSSGFENKETENLTLNPKRELRINREYAFDQRLFLNAVDKYERKEKKYDKKRISKGVVVPHHLLASELIAELFSLISDEEVETVIILSPNHDERGDENIISSDFGFETQTGIIEPDYEIIESLANRDSVKLDNDSIKKEHGILGLLPFIKHYFGDVKIVPIILKKQTTIEEIDQLSHELSVQLNKEGVIMVASVDFSHYLPAATSHQKDAETLQAIYDKDYQKIYDFTNDNLDSPASILILMHSMNRIGADELGLVRNTNSLKLLESASGSENTSYFTLIYSRFVQ